MKNRKLIPTILLTLVVCAFALVGFAAQQESGPIDRKQLKDMLTQLGYDVKDLDSTAGKEKYSTTIEREGLNIPVAFEISPNGNYIWMTIFCKQLPEGDAMPNGKALLKANADLQPSQFYVTKSNKLMMALCLENHGVTNALLRQRAEKIVGDVAKSKDTWQQ
jgi:hypothetical protein